MKTYPKENISYRYNFSKAEQENNSQLMANAAVNIGELEDEKKAVMSEYKAKIDAKSSELNLLSRYVIDKYTTKTMFAEKRKNFTAMIWEWFDEDGVVVKTEPLVGKDRQRDIFDEPEPTPVPEPTADEELAAHDNELWEAAAKTAAGDEVVSPDVEDLQNDQNAEQVHEAVLMLTPPPPKQLAVGEPEPAAEAPELPTLPEATSTEDEPYEKSDNEGADFNADAFNPEPPASLDKYPAKKAKATKPVATTSKKPGRPKKA